MRMFRTTIEYKQHWSGGETEYADRFYPSSKTCSMCGSIKEDLRLEDRVYSCYNCGGEMDRDWNAAVNLSRYVGQVLPEVNGQGEAKVHGAVMSQVGFGEMSIKQEVYG